MKSQPIEKIRKRFKREWLLFAVTEMDERKTLPLKGRLITHSPRQDDVYRALLCHKGRTYMTFSDDNLPMGYAAAF